MSGLLSVVPDAWVIGWPIALFVLAIVNSIVTGVLVNRSKRIDTLEERVTDSANATIDTRFQSMDRQLGEVQERLIRGEESFKTLRETDTQLRVQFVERLSDLKSYVAENCASKEDVEELKRMLMQVPR